MTRSLGTASPGAIWSQVEISVGVISACLPVYRPLFGRSKESSRTGYTGYSSKGSKKPRGIPLSDRSEGFGGWSTVSTAQGPGDDAVDRATAGISDSDVIHTDASFTVARESVI